MKLAGGLALALAVVLAIWAGTDYAHNKEQENFHVETLQTEIHMGRAGGSIADSAMDDLKDDDGKEQYDAIIGIVATCALIGSVVLFAKSGKRE